MTSSPTPPPRSPDAALADVLALVRVVGGEMVDVLEACGRVLADDVTAELDLPPWDNSAADGYALRTAEAMPGSPLPVAFTVAAGAVPGGLPLRHAARIMTGAPVPAGADAIIMREETDETDPSAVTPARRPALGENIRRRGEDVARGSKVLVCGTRLHPADVGLLVGIGRVRVRVRRRPVVAILSTGDEIAEAGTPPAPHRIHNSNAWMLAAQVLEAGGTPRVLSIAPDRKDALAAALREAHPADALVTIGGVSVGDFDFVKEALDEVGARLSFWKVAIRPGRPLAVGTLGGTVVFGLPGNPVSSFVTFELFVRPALRAMQGLAGIHRRRVRAVFRGSYTGKTGLTHYVRVLLQRSPSGVVAHFRPQQSSGALSSISPADGLMVVPPDRSPVADGDDVDVMVLRDDWDAPPAPRVPGSGP